MVKRILIGTLFVGLIGFLAAGAVIRTLDRTGPAAAAASEETREQTGQGRGRDAEAAGECGVDGPKTEGTDLRGQGNGNADRRATGEQVGAGQAEVDEWVQISGAVVAVDAEMLTVQLPDGNQLIVDGRAWRYVQEQGFAISVGDEVTLIGFFENGDLEVGQIDDYTSGQTVSIRDESGRPLWAGRGRGGQF